MANITVCKNSWHIKQGKPCLHENLMLKNMCINVETLISLFDTYVASIFNYGCEVWGSHYANDVEKVHLEY